MARYELDEDDEKILNPPQGTTLIFAGTNGTESWIEREIDTVGRAVVTIRKRAA